MHKTFIRLSGFLKHSSIALKLQNKVSCWTEIEKCFSMQNKSPKKGANEKQNLVFLHEWLLNDVIAFSKGFIYFTTVILNLSLRRTSFADLYVTDLHWRSETIIFDSLLTPFESSRLIGAIEIIRDSFLVLFWHFTTFNDMWA